MGQVLFHPFWANFKLFSDSRENDKNWSNKTLRARLLSLLQFLKVRESNRFLEPIHCFSSDFNDFQAEQSPPLPSFPNKSDRHPRRRIAPSRVCEGAFLHWLQFHSIRRRLYVHVLLLCQIVCFLHQFLSSERERGR